MRSWSFAKPSLLLALLITPLACAPRHERPVALAAPGDAEGEPARSVTAEGGVAPEEGASFAEELTGDIVGDLEGDGFTRPPVTLFLNRRGGTFTKGSSHSALDRSSLVPASSSRATLAPFAGDEAQWREIVDCVGDQFAPFNVRLTEEEPTSGKYIEVVFGDRPDALGLPWKVAGIAPMDTKHGRTIERAVVFIFTERLGEERTGRICEVAAQEVGHAFGLDHEFLCEDPMSYLKGCSGTKVFQNIDARCGEHSPRDCSNGKKTQNSLQVLATKLGVRAGFSLPPPAVDQAPPQIALLDADDAEIDDEDVGLIAARVDDDVSVSRVELVWEEGGEERSVACPKSTETGRCRREGDRYVWRVKASRDARGFRVRAADAAGNVTVFDGDELVLRVRRPKAPALEAKAAAEAEPASRI